MSNINQDDLSFRYGPSKAYYFNHFHELTEQLRLGFLIFGITAAFIIYGLIVTGLALASHTVQTVNKETHLHMFM